VVLCLVRREGIHCSDLRGPFLSIPNPDDKTLASCCQGAYPADYEMDSLMLCRTKETVWSAPSDWDALHQLLRQIWRSGVLPGEDILQAYVASALWLLSRIERNCDSCQKCQ